MWRKNMRQPQTVLCFPPHKQEQNPTRPAPALVPSPSAQQEIEV